MRKNPEPSRLVLHLRGQVHQLGELQRRLDEAFLAIVDLPVSPGAAAVVGLEQLIERAEKLTCKAEALAAQPALPFGEAGN